MRRWRVVRPLSTFRSGAYALWLVALVGCSTPPVYVSNAFYVPKKVAVLPMENATNDFDGPWLVRDLLATRLSQRGYAILPSADVDRLLKEQGFTDGGQLKRVEPKQLGEWLGVDAVFYSTLLDFSYVNLGFYTHRKVKVESHLVDVKTGEKLWGAERTWFTFNVETDKEKAGTNFAVQLVTQAVERWAKVPLKAEAEWAVDLLLQTLPYR